MDIKLKNYEVQAEKTNEETIMKEKQMKSVIQELTAKFKKLKDEKDNLRN